MAASISSPATHPFAFNLIEMNSGDFFKQFQNVLIVEQDEIETSTEQAINSFAMLNCVTLFGLKRNLGKIEHIFAYQIGASAEEYDIQDKLEGEGINRKYDFCLVDCYARASSSGLLDTIDTALIKLFRSNNFIIGGWTNLNAGYSERYISANLQMNGQLTFCRHS